MVSNERFQITVVDQQTKEVRTFDADDFIFLHVEGYEVTEWMIECSVGQYPAVIKHITNEVKKVRDGEMMDKPAELN